jgi:replicative DNA helicase
MMQDDQLERNVLGALLLEPRSCQLYLEQLTPSMFATSTNAVIYEAMVALMQSQTEIDMLTITHRLRNTNKVAEAGGVKNVATLTNSVASTANLETWIFILKELAMKRAACRIATEVVNKTLTEGVDALELFADFTGQMDEVWRENVREGINTIGTIAPEATKNIVERANMSNPINGHASGIVAMDEILGGYQPTDLTYLAGRPGMGKTAMALSLAYNMASNGTPVAFFSLEMGKQQLFYRLASFATGLPAERLFKGKLTIEELKIYHANVERLNNLPIFVDDAGGLTITELRGKIKMLKHKKNVGVVFIDYVQLITATAPNKRATYNREQELSYVSRQLKQLAKECNVAMVVLSQLSRGVETRQDKRPLLSDLRETGSLEQDADVVAFLYRPEYYGIMEAEGGRSTAGLAEFIVAKQRNGRTGIVPVMFEAERMQYGNFLNYGTQKNEEFF